VVQEPNPPTETRVEVLAPEPAHEALTDSSPSPAEHRYGDGKAKLDFHIEDEKQRRVTTLRAGACYRIVCTVSAREALQDACVGVMIRTPRGVEVFGADSSIAPAPTVFNLAAGQQIQLLAQFTNHLAPGVYFLTAGVARVDGHKHDMRFDALEFMVEPSPGIYFASLVDLEVAFSAITADAQRTREEA